MERREALKKTLLALGYTVSVPSLVGIFNSCNSNSNSQNKWQPQFFSVEQAAVISELAETILPKTKTPGAKELKLDQFIDQFIKQVFSGEDQQRFLQGMVQFEKEAKQMNGNDFIDSAPEQRHKLLTKLEQESAKIPPSVWGITMQKDPPPLPFYRQVKELILVGYFTSEEIAKKVLVYNPVPGKFVADMPLVQPGYISFE
ncbi:MAG: gluconate 2-dehydrogenase subunit 3 family protein [Ginsengibacter sp.]